MPNKPFFMYYAPGANHAPHQVPAEWIGKYTGKFDAGWDAQREASFARQKALGIIPEDAQLTPRLAEIPAWGDMPADLLPVLRREMEIYAGFLEHTDYHVGRLVDAIQDRGVLDDTLIYYIVGDNGASAEGTPNGCFNELATLNGLPDLETPEFLISKIDSWAVPPPITITRSAGPGQWIHRTSGRSKWLRTGVAHGTARLFRGRTGSPPGANSGTNSRMSSTWRQRCWRLLVFPTRWWSTASSKRPSKASAWRMRS